MKNTFATREEWLAQAVKLLQQEVFKDDRIPVVRVSLGFADKSAHKTLGICYHATAAEDGVKQIYITPELGADVAAPQGVLATLTHELCHAILPDGAAHGPEFRTLARKVGLAGKAKATHATDALGWQLSAIAAELGPFPHAPLVFGEAEDKPKKQTNRHLKCECADCGYQARTSQRWIEDPGPPLCPRGHGPLTPEEKDPK